MKVNVVSSELIKPCTPTPPNLNKYRLSFLDELLPPENVGLIIVYPPISSSNTIPSQRRIQLLQESLAKILPQFYILAGRYIKNDHMIDCRDQGVLFIKAEADEVELIDLVKDTQGVLLNDLVPSAFYQVDESPTDPLLSIQITEIKNCGGIVISVSISHRIFDASSVGTFIDAWSDANNNPEGEITILPSFESAMLFPSTLSSSPPRNILDPSIVMKRVSFDKESIAILRSKLSPLNPNTRISRVRVACAVIAKALMRIDQAKHIGESRASMMCQAVNMRRRTIPPLREHSCGNLSLLSPTRCFFPSETTNSVTGGIKQLVDILGEALEKTNADCAEMFSPGGRGFHGIIMGIVASMCEKLGSGDVNFMMFIDWSKFGFYQVDFGWGKPVVLGIGANHGQNTIVLMDSKEGDGIEAWVHLNSEDMDYFVQDQDIKLYTSMP